MSFKMRNIYRIAAVTILLAGFAGCGFSETQKNTQKSEETSLRTEKESTSKKEKESNKFEFTSADRGISVTLPKGWTNSKDLITGHLFVNGQGDSLEISYTEGRANLAKIIFPSNKEEAQSLLQTDESNEAGSTVTMFRTSLIDMEVKEPVTYYQYEANAQVDGKNTGTQLGIGLKQKNEAYQITLLVTSGNQTLLELQKALENMVFLESEDFTTALKAGLENRGSTGKQSIPTGIPEFGTEEYNAELPADGWMECSGDVNVRTAPSSGEGEIIGTLEEGDEVQVTGFDGHWYQVVYENQVAYVYKSYLK